MSERAINIEYGQALFCDPILKDVSCCQSINTIKKPNHRGKSSSYLYLTDSFISFFFELLLSKVNLLFFGSLSVMLRF